MGFVRYLQHWLSGTGTPLQVTEFVPQSDPIRQWADTFPWGALVDAIEQSFAQRFPKTSKRGRPPAPIRVLLALELLKHELGASDEDICRRFRTDFAVMYACGLRAYRMYAITGGVNGGVMFFSRARRDQADGPGRSW